MATKTLSENVQCAINTFLDIKEALTEQGLEIADGTPASSFAAKIQELQSYEFPEKRYVAVSSNENDIPNSVILYGLTKVPDYCFSSDGGGCMAVLEHVDFSNVAITEIGQYAFNLCENLELASLPETLGCIGEAAFKQCRKLALTALPNNVTTIGSRAFYECGNLALTSLPPNITTIREDTFSSCRNLALTSLPDNLANIGRFAFSWCEKIKLTSLPNSLNSIGGGAFYECSGLETLSIGNNITFIDSKAFGCCPNLTSITIAKPLGSVSDAPWGAENATITWTG